MAFSINKQIVLSKNLINSFSKIYGVNKATLTLLIKFLGVKETTPIKSLTSSHIQKIKFFFENHESLYVLKDKLRDTFMNVKRLMLIKSYRGFRHQKHLPVRGQRTHTNSKTCKRCFIIKESFNVPKKVNNKKIPIKKVGGLKKKK